jgi:hypothetical protein
MEMSGHIHVQAALTLSEKSPRYSLDRGWVGPRAGLDTAEQRNTLAPARSRTSAVQPVAIPTARVALC